MALPPRNIQLEPIIDPNYYQNSPDYHGGSIEDSQPWLKKYGKVILEQMDNPFKMIGDQHE